jgi:hypothetical protein
VRTTLNIDLAAGSLSIIEFKKLIIDLLYSHYF